ncbi:MAG: aspartate--tRNA ligase [Candidatus Paceibacterota bacterium]
MKERIYIKDLKNRVGDSVCVLGLVDIRRDHGKLIFLDLRDETGKVQAVALPNHTEAQEVANKLRTEWVVEVTAQVNERPPKMVKQDEMNGSIELELLSITILNESETPAIDISTDGHEIGEESRLRYRYLDLRRARLQKNIRKRYEVTKFIRDFLDAKNFIEIETPLLTKSTPEGARDYIVPSRLDNGQFYALPQSPQQFKQLLMASGFEKYFQIARCMRDEDTRGDRQPEFTQLDMEMAFPTREEILRLNEELLIDIVKVLFPEKVIQQIPFPRLTYKEAMEKYGNDRPDLREDKKDPNLLAFCWVIDFPLFEKTDTGYTFSHNPFCSPKDEYVDDVMNEKNLESIISNQYDIALNGLEIGGGSIRIHNAKVQEKILAILGHSPEAIQENFGHMLEAFKTGTPPHGGIAWGFDRLLMILLNEPNIREVIAFPKTGEGRDLMLEAPSKVSATQLIELGISIDKKA